MHKAPFAHIHRMRSVGSDICVSENESNRAVSGCPIGFGVLERSAPTKDLATEEMGMDMQDQPKGR